MSRRRTFFNNSGVPEYNLVIGGMYPSKISNEAELASYFTFAEGDISAFEPNVPSTGYISAVVPQYVETPSLSFFQSGVSYFYFKGTGMYTNYYCFGNNSGLVYWEADLGGGTLLTNQRIFVSCGNLNWNNIVINGKINSGGSRINQMFSANQSDPTSVLDLTQTTALSLANLQYQAFAGNTGTVDLRNCTTINPSYDSRLFENFIGTARLWSCTNLYNTLSSTGTVARTVFNLSCRIEINIALATINGGSPHASLVAAANLGCDVHFYESDGTYVSALQPIIYYPFDGNANDVIGGLNGVENNITYTPEVVGQSAVFDSTLSSRIEIADNTAFSFTDGTTDLPFSISFLWKIDSAPSTNIYFIAKSSSNSNREYLIEYATSRQFRVYLWKKDNSARLVAQSTAYATSYGVWQHFTFTYDGSELEAGMKQYRNGVASTVDFTLSSGTYNGMTNTSAATWIGMMQSYTTPKFSGNLKNLKIWNAELQQAQITTESTAQLLEV